MGQAAPHEEHGSSDPVEPTVAPPILLAREHLQAGVEFGHGSSHFREQLSEHFESLRKCHTAFLEFARQDKELAPAGEWLVDNFAKAEQHYQQALHDFPKGYSKRLPRLKAGPHQGRPRIYSLTSQYLQDNEARFTPEASIAFINAYQEVCPLSIGELWAFAIHLRALLIEQASLISNRTLVSQLARDRGDQMLAAALEGKGKWDVAAALSRFPAHAQFSLLVHLLRRLRDRRGLDATHYAEIERHLRAAGFEPEAAVSEEGGRQGRNNLMMQNIFKGFTAIGELDWESWFGSVSLVDKRLAGSSDYPSLDNASKRLYRNAVEDLGRHSSQSELEISAKAVELGEGVSGVALLGGGRAALESAVGYHLPLLRRLSRLTEQQKFAAYGLGLLFLTGLFTFLGTRVAPRLDPAPEWVLIILLVLPASEAAFALVNFVITQCLRPTVLPGYAFRQGIPADRRTIIAVPAMLHSFHSVESVLDRLEDHFLSNRDAQLHYALLTDWEDAVTETTPNDAALLAAVTAGIAELNRRHATSQFVLFHRKRQWNAREGCWMGWERKRGKLEELNHFLRGKRHTSFIEAPAHLPAGARYVIVLDADTQLPPGAARQLVGKISHPLNEPVYDPVAGRVCQGYGILQPRITIALPPAGRGSIYRRVFAHRPGLDPYVFAVSDAYQDLFSEGSFAGKGIYDIDTMLLATWGRIPENAVLSHDLLEGNYARAALASDVQVVEDFPDQYLVDMARHHRWIRGDWQLLPWLKPGQPGITLLGWWKLADNLRRSLLQPGLLAALLAGWAFLPEKGAHNWTIFLVTLAFIPVFLPIFAGSTLRREEITTFSEVRTLADDLLTALAVVALNLALLAHRALMALQAIGVTLFRLMVSHRHMLRWVAAAQLRHRIESGWVSILYKTWPSSVLGLALVAAWGAQLAGRHIAVPSAVLPFGLVWALVPVIVFVITEPQQQEEGGRSLSKREVELLRDIALSTWRYFDVHVTAENNMLPPDNLQESPVKALATRTSPTNIGIYLLSVVSACEMGWIGVDEALGRISVTLDHAAKLEHFRGHLLNWHDTVTLKPLEPRYVSSVDSGNYTAHLIAVANALKKWSEASPIRPLRLEGLCDCARQVDLCIAKLAQQHHRLVPEAGRIRKQLAVLTAAVRELIAKIETVPLRILSLGVQINVISQSCHRLMRPAGDPASVNCAYWLGKLRQSAEAFTQEVTRDEAAQEALGQRLADCSLRCRNTAFAMDFSFLLSRERHMLSVGYRVADEALDEPCYDLLASEAALTCFFAIAKGDIDVELWQKLGRPVTSVRNAACLVSWSGSMFEYLMPNIVLHAPAQTLVRQSLELVVWKQVRYGRQNGVPWGISESAFAARDVHQTYQYSNFGVPGLGLKRGLGENLVIAPYATALAAMVDGVAAVRNFLTLEKIGARGDFGFYEAVDYTLHRLPAGQNCEVVKAYFAHHQGMTITSLHNTVSGGELRALFHAESCVRAAELLLQERAPYHVPSRTVTVTDMPDARHAVTDQADLAGQRMRVRDLDFPATALYSNGKLHAALSADGSSHLRWNGISINRWQPDLLDEPGGMRLMLRRLPGGTPMPLHFSSQAGSGLDHQARFHQDKAEFFWSYRNLQCAIEYFIAPDSNAELRRISITNHGGSQLQLELTGYMELVLAAQADDQAHPAFSKLFVHTEYDVDLRAVLATRRKRLSSDPEIWTGHFITMPSSMLLTESYETDRATFLGRGRSFENARVFDPDQSLSGSTGFVLDPCFGFRACVSAQPQDSLQLLVWTVVGASRAEVVGLIRKHQAADSYERIKTFSWTFARIGLRHLGLEADQAALFQSLSARLVYSSPEFRPLGGQIAQAMPAQATLWQHGISGTRPIVLVRIDNINDLGFVQDMLRGHEYWGARGLWVDLVILNESKASYLQDLHSALQDLIWRSQKRQPPDGVADKQLFLLRASQLPAGQAEGLEAAAHLVLLASHGPLNMPARPAHKRKARVAPVWSAAYAQQPMAPRAKAGVSQLQFFNGFGGFDRAAQEYVIIHEAARSLPAPWINVIANANFGTHCSAEGGGYTWFGNSKEQQITPWRNDPVRDRPCEMFHVRDLATGQLSSPCLRPLGPRNAVLRTRHGFGYTIHESQENGLNLELAVTVDAERAIKLSRLRIHNTGKLPAELLVTFYADLAMGAGQRQFMHYVTSAYDDGAKALFFQNRFSPLFGDAIIFSGMLGGQDVATADRTPFLDDSFFLSTPSFTLPKPLERATGGGLDPCVLLRRKLTLEPGAEKDVIVVMGKASGTDEARNLVSEAERRGFDAVLESQKQACAPVSHTLMVKTPDPAFDVMMNGWLMYQCLVGRFLARSGFYQASGAFGFRDQLQDAMAFAYIRPDLARGHLLHSAGRQFVEGDVQHWWLPETGAGVRTHISDDGFWLAYCTAHYVNLTGDTQILDEELDFLAGDPVPSGAHDIFSVPRPADRKASLYEHCVLALDAAGAPGPHGVPLMGTGDWNDGMNAVGSGGRGESVWLGWFACATLQSFAKLAEARGDGAKAKQWRDRVADLARALDTSGWDGKWFRRAYFDDGTPLGTASAAECRIDSIAQSWATLSGVASPEKAALALDANDTELVDRQARISRLFSPPLQNHEPSAGYIQSYPPGVRENGGQYSHGAIWMIFALAKAGRPDQAYELFNLINPVTHALDEEQAMRYRVEPYVAVADIYGAPPFTGRGGWTWYTGAAGWLYRAGLEAILGMQWAGQKLRFAPCIPSEWPGFTLEISRLGAQFTVIATRGRSASAAPGHQIKANEEIDVAALGAGAVVHLLLE